MIVYHFLPADHALDNIRKQRIKISEIDQLNDPFELWCVYQRDRQIRDALRGVKKDFCARFGLICFCKNWKNPLLWSHYANKHRGICLGFEVSGQVIKPVSYVRDRPKLTFPLAKNAGDLLIFTKYSGWQYEEEWRGYAQLEERDEATKRYFQNFGAQIQLRNVIAGPLCDVSDTEINDALASYKNDSVEVLKARLSFGRFEVVKNEQGFRDFSD